MQREIEKKCLSVFWVYHCVYCACNNTQKQNDRVQDDDKGFHIG